MIFETLGSLLSLLRKGERSAYCQFFTDAMSLIEGDFWFSILEFLANNELGHTN